MKKMIDELWDGEISPQDNLISNNQEYRELQHQQSQNKSDLLESLSREQKELLEKYCKTEMELNGISEREAFKLSRVCRSRVEIGVQSQLAEAKHVEATDR